MYADRVETGNKVSIRERLEDSTTYSGGRRGIAGKRQRQEDDKWEHDLYSESKPQINRKVGPQDLRLKLQRKRLQPVAQIRKGPISPVVKDLRERLSGLRNSQPVNNNSSKLKAVPETSKRAKNVALVEPSVPETKIVAKPSSTKKNQPKADTIDRFLRSEGLEKYIITFQAEEVDMATLVHMTDGDLKALGIPMGPRKKILLALDARG